MSLTLNARYVVGMVKQMNITSRSVTTKKVYIYIFFSGHHFLAGLHHFYTTGSHLNNHHSKTIERCSLKSVTTTLSLLFNWPHILLHSAVFVTFGNLVLSPPKVFLPCVYDVVIMHLYD